MTTDDDLLSELAVVFHGELLDAIHALDHASATIDDPEARAHAGPEIYRIVHGVKGAARAVGQVQLANVLHGLEDELDVMRRSERWGLSRLRGLVERAVDAMRSALEPDEVGAVSAGPTPEPTQEPATTRVRMSALLDVLRSAEDATVSVDRAVEAARGNAPETVRDLISDLERVRRLLDDETVGRQVTIHALTSAIGRATGLRARLASDEGTLQLAHDVLRGAINRTAERARSLGAVALTELAPAIRASAEKVSGEVGKPVRVDLDLAHAELDRRIVEALREPLLHLIANAIDHGIEPFEERRAAGKSETGVVRVVGRVVGREARIEVSDDGRGFDVAALRGAAERLGVASDGHAWQVAFEPGVTTRSEASSISGRGVGLDAVRQRVSLVRGKIEVETQPGRGTRVVMTVPVDLSIIRALLVRVGLHIAAIASTNVVQLSRIGRDELVQHEGHTYVRTGGATIPFVELPELLGFRQRLDAPKADDERIRYVLVAAGERRIALGVDGFAVEREIFVKSLGRRVRRVPYVSAAAVLDRGEVALVLDPAEIVALGRPGRVAEAPATAPTKTVLVVDDSVTTRQLERAVLEAAGFRVLLAADGAAAWQIVSETDVDVVLSDIEMPHMDGFELLSRIRGQAKTSQLPVVLVTALANEHDRRRGLDLGANAYILKSQFDQDQLLELLRTLA